MDHRETLTNRAEPPTGAFDETQVRLDRLRRLAGLMDNRFRVPGTGIRFGLDPLLGLVPGIGDSATAVVSLWIVYEARHLGATAGTIARMLGNIGIDLVVGTIPLIGDLFDITSRANQKNVALLEKKLREGGGRTGARQTL